jgi:hypothetical protein
METAIEIIARHARAQGRRFTVFRCGPLTCCGGRVNEKMNAILVEHKRGCQHRAWRSR